MKPSIIQNEPKQCYLCGRQFGLEHHHVMPGPNRKISDKYGLWVWLCHNCHTGPNGAQYDKERSVALKQDAQRAFEKMYSHDMWMELFRRNYL